MQANPILLQRKYASEGVADMHCLSDEYLAEEVEREIDGLYDIVKVQTT